MPRGLEYRRQEVMITDHAFNDRWPERAGIRISRKRLLARIRARLTAQARSEGIHLDATGAGWVEVYPWLWATVRLTERGWLVMTFIAWPEEEQTG